MKTAFQILILLALVTIGIFGIKKSVIPQLDHPTSSSSVGAYDFLFYYCPFQLWKDGKNPYAKADLKKILHELDSEPTLPELLSIYPPIIFPILSPILLLPFKSAVLTWFFLNICFIIASSYLVWTTFSTQKDKWPIALVAMCFFIPVPEVLLWGQLGLLLLFAISLFYWAAKREHDRLAGACLTVLTIKPHLFLILIPFLLCWALYKKG